MTRSTSALDATPDVVCIGAAGLDLLLAPDRLPAPDDRVAAQEGAMAGGGPAATAAVALARLGARVELVARVADDIAGRIIREQLADEGVGIRWLSSVGVDARSALSSGIILAGPPPTRSLIALPAQPPLALPDLASGAIDACRGARWLHVDHAGWPLVPGLRAMGIRTPVSLDGGNPITGLDLSLVDLYVPSMSELRRWTGVTTDEDALAAALAAGARMVIATRGDAGAAYLGPDDPERAPQDDAAAGSQARSGLPWRLDMPAYPVEVRSTLGAGDVYHGALLAALLEGASVRVAMAQAAVAAALACRALDGRSAIPDRPLLRTTLDAWSAEPSPSWRPDA